MGDENIKAIEILSDTINNIIDKKMDNVARDRTRIGMIVDVNTNGTFDILLDGKIYNNIPSYGEADIVVNEIVKVIYPDNNVSNMFILPKIKTVTSTTNGLMTNEQFTDLEALKIFHNPRIVKYYSTPTGDCNNITDELHLGGNGSAHYPIIGSNIWWYVHTFWYDTGNSTGKQIAYGYNGTYKDRMFTRVKVSGTWYDWVEVQTSPVPLTFTFSTSADIVTQATKTAVAYYYPALETGFIRAFCEVGTGGWALNTIVTIGAITSPTGKNILTQPLSGSRSYNWAGIVEPTFINTSTGANLRITMKNAAATSGMGIYVAGMFLVK